MQQSESCFGFAQSRRRRARAGGGEEPDRRAGVPSRPRQQGRQGGSSCKKRESVCNIIIIIIPPRQNSVAAAAKKCGFIQAVARAGRLVFQHTHIQAAHTSALSAGHTQIHTTRRLHPRNTAKHAAAGHRALSHPISRPRLLLARLPLLVWLWGGGCGWRRRTRAASGPANSPWPCQWHSRAP